MSAGERYRQAGRRRLVDGVACFDGVDAVTRNPVLIYEFGGDPVAGCLEFVSEHACRVLTVTYDQGDRNRLVAALPPGWRRWSRAHGPLTGAETLGLARALRDAAREGLVHGRISPAQVILTHGRALLSGYGVPWPDRTTDLADDVGALAFALEQTGVEGADETLSALLEQCRLEDRELRPSAEELCLALENLFPEGAEALDAAPPPPEAPAEAASEEDDFDDHVAALREMERVAGRRRIVLLSVLFLSVVVLALLALYGPRFASGGMRASQESTVYVVEVNVLPEDLPPVTIHLVSSPAGSELERGRVLGTAPRHLALDRPGVWAFQGVLQDRRSQVVEIVVPQERSLTLVLPPAAP